MNLVHPIYESSNPIYESSNATLLSPGNTLNPFLLKRIITYMFFISNAFFWLSLSVA